MAVRTWVDGKLSLHSGGETLLPDPLVVALCHVHEERQPTAYDWNRHPDA